MLRARFSKRADGSMAQKLFKNAERSCAWELRPQQSPAKRDSTTQMLAKGICQPGSPVFGVSLFGTKESISHVSLIAHRAAVDSSSWHIVLHEFKQLLSGDTLPNTRENTYFDWIQDNVTTEYDERDNNQLQPAERHSATSTLDASTTEKLFGEECHRALRTTLEDIFCATLLLSIHHAEKSLMDGISLGEIDNVGEEITSKWNGIVGCLHHINNVDM